MDWDDLRIVLAVSRHRSFSAAARALGLTQPTVGRRIRRLEERLGTLVFERGTAGHDLTDAGAQLCVSAERVEESIYEAERKLAGSDRRVEGVVRVTTTSLLAQEILMPTVRTLEEDHPGIVMEILSDNRVLNLHRREADLALRPFAFEGPDIVARRIAKFPCAAYASPSYGGRSHKAPALLIPDESQWATPEVSWLLDAFPQGRIVLRANHRTILLQAALQGGGVVCLPTIIGDHVTGLSRFADDLGPTQSLWLGLHRNLMDIPRFQIIGDAIRTELSRRSVSGEMNC